jgi:hypothetical protein
VIKIEKTEVFGWEAAIRGMRNPMNSWDKSDSGYVCGDKKCSAIPECNINCDIPHYMIGPNDLKLMMKLRNAGTDHRKFMRMITVYLDITAPLYWWKEFDTYKVGTVANSCSTMHKIADKEFTVEDFSCEHLLQSSTAQLELYSALNCAPSCYGKPQWTPMMHLLSTIAGLNHYREKYLETKTKPMKNESARAKLLKTYWWQMIKLLPSSYNQKRTVMLNYEVLANIYKSRYNHRLDEWCEFRKWVETLPYAKGLIYNDTEKE